MAGSISKKKKKKKKAIQSMQLNKIEMCICHRSKGNKFIKTAAHWMVY